MTPDQLLTEFGSLTARIRDERPATVSFGGRDVEVEYIDDPEDGSEFARIALALPDQWYAEIDSDTYGTLYAARLCLD
jgi:hypothetical protein